MTPHMSHTKEFRND